MKTQDINSVITRLIIDAFDRAGVRESDWAELKISATKLHRLRAGDAILKDADLDRISRTAGEPWEHLVLRLLDDGAAVTNETREIITSLHMLSRVANAEATELPTRPKGPKSGNGLLKRLRSRPRNRRLSA